MTYAHELRQGFEALPTEVKRQLMRIAVTAVAMNDDERAAATQAMVTRAYGVAMFGAEPLTPLTEIDTACAQVLRLTADEKAVI